MIFPPCSICRRRLVTTAEQTSNTCVRCAVDPEAGKRTAAYDVEMDALERAASPRHRMRRKAFES